MKAIFVIGGLYSQGLAEHALINLATEFQTRCSRISKIF